MSRPQQQIALMLVLGVFVWTSRVIAGNIGALPVFSAALTREFGDLNGTVGLGSNAATNSLLPDTTTSAQEALFSSLVILGVLMGFAFYRVRRSLPKTEMNRSTVTGFLFLSVGAFAVLLVAGRFFVDILLDLSQPRPGAVSLYTVLSNAVFIAGGVAVAVSVGALGLAVARRATRRVGSVGEASEVARDFTRAIDSGVYSLRSTPDFRGAVLNCYRSLCDVLQRGGAEDRPELTAREFETLAIDRLSIGRGNIERITQLFEKARYSRDVVDEEDAKEAESTLLDLQRELAEKGQVGAS